MEDPISTQKAPKPVGLYPHARKAGNLLFLSGRTTVEINSLPTPIAIELKCIATIK